MHDIVNGMNQVLLPGGVGLALFIPFIVVVTFLAVAIHECVHAVVGVLVGFHFNSLRIGPVLFDRPFRISIYHGRGTGAGGWTSLFPVKQDRLILRTIIMLLAGPLSNLISVALLHELPYSKGMFSAWFMYVSLLLGVMNLLPFRNRAVISDGGRILMLLQNRPRGERWLAMLKLLEEIRQGVPQENLSSGFLAKAVAIQDNSPDTFTAHAIAYAAAFWQHKNNEAAQALETCLRYSSVVSPTQRHAIMIDAAVFQARRRKRVDLAEQWLADVPQKTEYPWFRLRGEAAILEAKGDISGALTKLDEVIKLIQATPNQAMREISLRGVSRWKAELLPAITEAASAKSLI
ncbi:MAG TPA: hypothetical protein VJW20_09540 [Candidatus Angelobacter sp.]|nr:hypothetical protein [Candidatus Angelobacter sp.]